MITKDELREEAFWKAFNYDDCLSKKDMMLKLNIQIDIVQVQLTELRKDPFYAPEVEDLEWELAFLKKELKRIR